MSNRKARRQKAGNSSSVKDDLGVDHIPLAHPDRSGPKAKTLFEIAEERQRELKGTTKFSSQASSLGVGVEEVQWKDLWMHNEKAKGKGVIVPHKDGTTEEEEPAVEGHVVMFIEAIFYSISFSMLHFTLDVLVHSQYAIDIVWRTIIERTLVAFIGLLVLVSILHSNANLPAVQALFLILSVGAGAYLIHITNESPFLAIMKLAPRIGTVWVWSIIELRLPIALTSLAVCLAWTWWGGYSVM